jgi:hypothetical protein
MAKLKQLAASAEKPRFGKKTKKTDLNNMGSIVRKMNMLIVPQSLHK